jgi:cytochrome c553
MKKVLTLSIAIILSTFASASFAGDAAAGKAKSVTCAGCHGINGISNNPKVWPNLAGREEAEIASALQMYRDGRRKHAVMSIMAKNLTDDEIDNLAAYFSSQKQK